MSCKKLFAEQIPNFTSALYTQSRATPNQIHTHTTNQPNRTEPPNLLPAPTPPTPPYAAPRQQQKTNPIFHLSGEKRVRLGVLTLVAVVFVCKWVGTFRAGIRRRRLNSIN